MDLDKLSKEALVSELNKRGKDAQGTKAVLKERLQEIMREEVSQAEENTEKEKAQLIQDEEKSEHDKKSETQIMKKSTQEDVVKKPAEDMMSTAWQSRFEERARLAGLAAKKQALMKKHKLEAQEADLRRMKEELQLQAEIDELEAREKVFAEMMAEAGSQSIAATPQDAAAQPQVSSERQEETAARQQEAAEQEEQEEESRLKTVKRLNLPSLELTIFRGEAASFKAFMRTFEANIARNLDCEAEKLLYLLKFTQGRPYDIVQTCVHLPEELGYVQAVKLLTRRYDSQTQTAANLVEKMLSRPTLRAEDGDGLDDYGIYLRGCLNALEALPDGLGSVDAKVIRQLLEKMPYHLTEKWRRIADAIEYEQNRTVNFKDLVDFVEKEARIATNPSYGRQVLGTRSKTKNDFVQRTEMQASKRVVSGRTMAGSVRPTETSCLFCGCGHQTEACRKLEHKTQEEKSKFVKEKGLCFACLKTGHRSKFCRERMVCEKCGKRHPTVLHENRTPTTETPSATTGHLASLKTGGAKLQIVRVRVGSGPGGNKVTTNAFLDTGSTHSFIAGSLLDEMKTAPRNKTPLKLSTIRGEEKMKSSIVPGLLIEDLKGDNIMELPPLYVLNRIPVMTEDIPSQEDVEMWSYLEEAGVSLREMDANEEIGLLIGGNAASVMEPLEICQSQDGGPYAVRTRYGWVLGGAEKTSKSIRVNRIKIIDETSLDEQFENLADTRRGLSVEDAMWCTQMETGCGKKDGRYEINLPFREKKPLLENNREVAQRRLDLLKRTFEKDPSYAKEYNAVMADLLEKGYAEEAPEDGEPAGKWYLPHFGVRNPQKETVSVVFDCASKFRGKSLNDTLLQGPDLANPLMEVLLRFREQPYAFTGDIEAMFMQVLVPEPQRDYLRFLWWPQGDVNCSPREYRNTRHLFGATSSPSCANLALHRTAEDFGQQMAEARNTVRRNFYVDDLLKSVGSEEAAVELLRDVKKLCANGGFNLTKFSSNSVKVLQSVPREERAKNLKDLTLGFDSLPLERALGVLWDTESDSFGFQVSVDKLMRKPASKRGMLSATASCYDPLGLVTPCIVGARILIQDLFRLKVGWDDKVPDSTRKAWERWLRDLRYLSSYRIPRCLTMGEMGGVVAELHHFSDASERAYGTVSFLRTVKPDGEVHCALLMSKARLAPVKTLSIVRLELAAAKLAVEVGQDLSRALDIRVEQTFWTDSTTVLKYIKNERSRFHVFVSNRLAVIHDGSRVDQWRYVPTDQNPADLVSRGADAETLISSKLWHSGPQFLTESADKWPRHPDAAEEVSEDDPEVKARSICMTVKLEEPDISPMRTLIEYFSSWKRLTRAVAWIRLVIETLRDRVRGRITLIPPELTMLDIENAEKRVIQSIQETSFSQEIKDLRAGKEVRKTSPLARLDPVIRDGVLKAQGRLRNATISQAAKCPVILPQKGHAVDLLIADFHERAGHEGRQHVMADLNRSYWVLGANSAVRRVLSSCLSCRRRQRPPETQKMADLPEDRVQDGEKPFTRTGVDFFGNFFVKRGRSQVKKYGVLFTCLAVRAVHIEVADSLSTDSFVCALRRFVARRGEVRVLRSDRGTNFIGADRELRREVDNLMEKGDKIQRAALEMKIDWKFNPPHASHFGGAWERQIRTIRKILNALLTDQTFTDETLCTLLCEVESIINNRPLTPVSTDPRDEVPLTPNHLLHLRSVTLPSGDSATDADLVGRRQWKQAAYLSEQFWRRWRREYLPLLQTREGPCTRSMTNLKSGDVVLLVDDSVPRGVWPLGRVEGAPVSSDGRVRSVQVRVRGTIFERPVTKVVKIVEA